MPLLTLWHPGSSGPGFDPAPFAGGFGEPFDGSQLRQWVFAKYAPDTGGEWTPIPGLTVATVAQQAALFGDEQQQLRSVQPRWFATDPDGIPPAFPTLPAAAFDPATVDWGREGQQDRYTQPRWFAPEAEAKLPATPPSWGPSAGSFGDTANEPWHKALQWTDPSGGSSALVSVSVYRSIPTSNDPFTSAVLVGTVGAGVEALDDYYGDLHDWEDNPGLMSFRYWLVAINTEGLTSIVTALVGTTGDQLWASPDLGQPQDWRQPRWFTPDQEWHPTATGDGPAPPTFDPTSSIAWDALDVQQGVWPRTSFAADVIVNINTFVEYDPATLGWFNQELRQDRSTQPVWRQPDLASEAVFPILPTYVPPTTADLGALTQMDLHVKPFGHKRRLDNVLASGVMSQDPNLYSTFTPATPPYILINAENGDVFIYIGSNFIVPAYDGSS